CVRAADFIMLWRHFLHRFITARLYPLGYVPREVGGLCRIYRLGSFARMVCIGWLVLSVAVLWSAALLANQVFVHGLLPVTRAAPVRGRCGVGCVLGESKGSEAL